MTQITEELWGLRDNRYQLLGSLSLPVQLEVGHVEDDIAACGATTVFSLEFISGATPHKINRRKDEWDGKEYASMYLDTVEDWSRMLAQRKTLWSYHQECTEGEDVARKLETVLLGNTATTIVLHTEKYSHESTLVELLREHVTSFFDIYALSEKIPGDHETLKRARRCFHEYR
jgi:hypothetical protein